MDGKKGKKWMVGWLVGKNQNPEKTRQLAVCGCGWLEIGRSFYGVRIQYWTIVLFGVDSGDGGGGGRDVGWAENKKRKMNSIMAR